MKTTDKREALEPNRKDNTSGVKEVSRHSSGKWRAQLRLGKRRLHLGLWPTKAEAAAGYLAAVTLLAKLEDPETA